MSAISRSTCEFPDSRRTSSSAALPFSAFRQTITTCASICASPSAVSFPIPLFAPVTTHIFPFMFACSFIASLAPAPHLSSKVHRRKSTCFSRRMLAWFWNERNAPTRTKAPACCRSVSARARVFHGHHLPGFRSSTCVAFLASSASCASSTSPDYSTHGAE